MIYKAYYSATMASAYGCCEYLTLAPDGHENVIQVSEAVRLDKEHGLKWPDAQFVGHVTQCVKPYSRLEPRFQFGRWAK